MSMAVDVAPDQAYMSVALGDYRLKAGDRVGAAAAYKAALKYVPDYKEALDGLKKAEGR
jgi:predicted TPR repeat methyltransferase